jgi:hypothetical protein
VPSTRDPTTTHQQSYRGYRPEGGRTSAPIGGGNRGYEATNAVVHSPQKGDRERALTEEVAEQRHANSTVFGVMATANGYPDVALYVGWVPGVLLLTGFALRNRQRLVATIMLTLGAVGAATASG